MTRFHSAIDELAFLLAVTPENTERILEIVPEVLKEARAAEDAARDIRLSYYRSEYDEE